MFRRIRQLLLTALITGMVLGANSPAVQAASDNTLQNQRQAYLDARKALARGDNATFRRLMASLKDYPLYGYLEYETLQRRLTDHDAVRDFLAHHADSPLSDRLRRRWLDDLARRGEWQTLVREYRYGYGTTLHCRYLQAKIRTGRLDEVRDEIRNVWLVGESQPKECDAVFRTWIDNGGLTADEVWQRIDLAMEKRQLSLARYLGRFLSKAERTWLTRWADVHRRPKQALHAAALRQDTPVVRRIVRHGIRRLARIDAHAAYEEWQRLRPRYRFTPYTVASVERYIALKAAYQRKPQANAWLKNVDPQAKDNTVQEWRLRSALASRDWQDVGNAYAALPAEEQATSRWRYWQARALEETGRPDKARPIYSTLAGQRDYHGFLAADRLDMRYSLNDVAVKHTPEELAGIEAVPGILRARELYHLEYFHDARTEWQRGINSFNARQLELAAVLAHQWGWHDRAIFTVARAKHFNDLAMRFPVVYRTEVERNARKHRIDPAWVFGVIRQESAYMSDARSHAGALGLMQLMPRTARNISRLIQSPLHRTRDLFKIDKNIHLGTAYLRRMLDKNDDHAILATASYNAGPQRVRQWMPDAGAVPADVWVETMPFNETRTYVQRVMSYTAIFEQRLGLDITPLSTRMPQIKPAS